MRGKEEKKCRSFAFWRKDTDFFDVLNTGFLQLDGKEEEEEETGRNLRERNGEGRGDS